MQVIDFSVNLHGFGKNTWYQIGQVYISLKLGSDRVTVLVLENSVPFRGTFFGGIQ